MNTNTQNAPLSFNNDEELALHRLPFVGGSRKDFGLSFWNVPKTGGYAGGNMTGEALAGIYLKHLREHGQAAGGMLQTIAFSMFEHGDENDARRGQIVGFFAALEGVIRHSCRENRNLDNFKASDLLARANEGLLFDEEEYLASLEEEERLSEA